MNTQRKMRSTTMATYFQSSFTCKRRHVSPRRPRASHAAATPWSRPPRPPRLQARLGRGDKRGEVACPAAVWAQRHAGAGGLRGGRRHSHCGGQVWRCAPRCACLAGCLSSRVGGSGGRPLEEHQRPGRVVVKFALGLQKRGGVPWGPSVQSEQARPERGHPPAPHPPCRTRTRSSWVTEPDLRQEHPQAQVRGGAPLPILGRSGKRFPQCHFQL